MVDNLQYFYALHYLIIIIVMYLHSIFYSPLDFLMFNFILIHLLISFLFSLVIDFSIFTIDSFFTTFQMTMNKFILSESNVFIILIIFMFIHSKSIIFNLIQIINLRLN